MSEKMSGLSGCGCGRVSPIIGDAESGWNVENKVGHVMTGLLVLAHFVGMG